MASRKSERLQLSKLVAEMGKKTVGKRKKGTSTTDALEVFSSDSMEDTPLATLMPQLKKAKKDTEGEKEPDEGTPEKSKKEKQQEVGTASKPRIKQRAKRSLVIRDQDEQEKIAAEKRKKQMKKLADMGKGKEKIGEKKKKAKSSEKDTATASSINDKWFINNTTEGMWKDGFSENPIGYCSTLCPNLMAKLEENADCYTLLKASSIWNMFKFTKDAYPRLTRLFYVNMEANHVNGLSLTTRVAGVDMTLDHKVIAEVLGCNAVFENLELPNRKQALENARKEFFISNTTSTKQLTHTVLNAEAKILFTIFMRCVLPKENSKELISDKILYYMYLVMHGEEVDLPTLIMEHMWFYASMRKKCTLPYANLLPLFFKHFGIPLADEEKIKVKGGIVNETLLQNLGIVQTTEGKWKLYSELTEDELKAGKFGKPKALSSGAGGGSFQELLLKRMSLLEEEVYEIKGNQLEVFSSLESIKGLISALDKSVKELVAHVKLTEAQQESLSRQLEESAAKASEEKGSPPEVQTEKKGSPTESGNPQGVEVQKKQQQKKEKKETGDKGQGSGLKKTKQATESEEGDEDDDEISKVISATSPGHSEEESSDSEEDSNMAEEEDQDEEEDSSSDSDEGDVQMQKIDKSGSRKKKKASSDAED